MKTESKTLSPFDFVTSASDTKIDLMLDETNEKYYNAYIINRHFSYFKDSVLAANEMNIHSHLDKKMQFHFLLNILRKRKRFTKWSKPQEITDLQVVKEYYGYSNQKAKQALFLLSKDQLTELRKRMFKGGRK